MKIKKKKQLDLKVKYINNNLWGGQPTIAYRYSPFSALLIHGPAFVHRYIHYRHIGLLVGLPNWRYGWVNRISTGSRVLLVTRHAPGGYLHSIESRLGQRRDPIRTPSTYTCHASRTFTRARHRSRPWSFITCHQRLRYHRHHHR